MKTSPTQPSNGASSCVSLSAFSAASAGGFGRDPGSPRRLVAAGRQVVLIIEGRNTLVIGAGLPAGGVGLLVAQPEIARVDSGNEIATAIAASGINLEPINGARDTERKDRRSQRLGDKGIFPRGGELDGRSTGRLDTHRGVGLLPVGTRGRQQQERQKKNLAFIGGSFVSGEQNSPGRNSLPE